MLSVSLPKTPKYEEISENKGIFTIEGCYPGYGTTIGNALRRVLLSSLPGSAAVAVKIKGVTHEFTSIKGISEDVVQILLNIKKVKFKLIGVNESRVFLKVKGEKKIKAADFSHTSEVEVINGDQEIATLTSSGAELEMEILIENGLGYVSAEQQALNKEKEIGLINLDAIFTPIVKVNFNVSNMRIGKRTDFDKIELEINTNGSITPKEAYNQAVEILLSQFSVIFKVGNYDEISSKIENTINNLEGEKKRDDLEIDLEKNGENEKTERFKISTRTANVLKSNEILDINDITKFTEEEVLELEGMGEKGLKEIKKALSKAGLSLKK